MSIEGRARTIRVTAECAIACKEAADSNVEAMFADMSADEYRQLSFKLWDQAFRAVCTFPLNNL